MFLKKNNSLLAVPVVTMLTVTDSQFIINSELVKTALSKGYWDKVLIEAFNLIYEGKNVDSMISSVTYITNDKTYTSDAYDYASDGAYNIRSVIINVVLNNGLILPLTVDSIGKTIVIND